jgi:Spy/CpxP family protein refolding chaperone
MMKRTSVLIGLAAASLYAVSVYAHPPMMGGPGMGGGCGGGRLVHVLLRSADLTADQETQVHDILDADRSAVHDIFGQMRQAKDDLATLLLGSQDVQADALAAQLAKIDQVQQQLAQHEADTVLKIRALLTPDQLAKAAAAEAQMQARRPDFGPPGE